MNLQTMSKEPLPEAAEMTYASTYYPSTTDSATAVPIDVGAGGELRGIEIRLRKAPVFRIRGKVANVPAGRVMVSLSSKDGGVQMQGMSQAAPPDYRFEIRGVSAGSYILHAQIGNGNQQAVAFQEVNLTSQHLDGVVLSISGGNDLQGSIKIEDSTAPIPMPNLNLYLRPTLPVGVAPRAKVGDDLKFMLKNVMPLHYTVSVAGVPDSCYVKTIRFGGQPVPEDGVDMLSGGLLEVILSATAGEADATIVDKDGNPVSGALVALISKEKGLDGMQSRSSDEKGTVTFKGLKPGDYRLIAWEDIPRGASQDPEFVQRFESRGESVKIDASGQKSIQIKVIPVEETDN